MFMGMYEHTVDDKGRLSIPAKFRQALRDGLVITRGWSGYLMVFPPDDWARLIANIRQRQMSQNEMQTFSRFIFPNTTEGELDKPGRVNIPQHLREYAGLNTDVVIVGMDTHLEIWDREHWRLERERVEREGPQVANERLDGIWF